MNNQTSFEATGLVPWSVTKDKVLIVIPAKGNSKRLPGKNLMKLGGTFGDKTLIEIAIERAIKSDLGMVVVSTDSPEILDSTLLWIDNCIHKGGVDMCKAAPNLLVVPRGEGVRKDNTRAWEVCLDAVDQLKAIYNSEYDTLIMTLPTSPFCTSKHIKEAYQMFLENDRESVMSVKKCEFNPETLCDKKMVAKDYLFPYDTDNMFWKNGVGKHKRDVFISNGAVWVIKVDELIEKKEQYMQGMHGYEMDEVDSINIDTELDYITACAVAKEYEGWGIAL